MDSRTRTKFGRDAVGVRYKNGDYCLTQMWASNGRVYGVAGLAEKLSPTVSTPVAIHQELHVSSLPSAFPSDSHSRLAELALRDCDMAMSEVVNPAGWAAHCKWPSGRWRS